MINDSKIEELEKLASIMRGRIIETSCHTKTPHLGSCLSCVDILVALYFNELKINPQQPNDPLRDRFILSKGHGAPAIFQILAERGYYPVSDLEKYGEDGSVFHEHPPAPKYLPGIEAATGSLGHGLPMGLGMALAAKTQKQDYRVFVVLSDGECNEGSVWEAAMFAGAQKLENVIVIVDFNKWQATGRSEDVMALNPLPEKWEAFGWSTYEIDGNNMNELTSVLSKSPDGSGKPVAIIAHTVKGKGVSFMEDDNNWHYRTPTTDEVDMAKKELGIAL